MKEALCGDSGAILGHCGSTLGVSLAGAKVQSGKAQLAPSSRPRSVSIGDRHEIEFIVPHPGSRDCSVVGELRSDCDSRNSSQFCSNHLAASRQEALSFRRFGVPTTSPAACSTAFWAESSMLFGCSASFSPFSGMVGVLFTAALIKVIGMSLIPAFDGLATAITDESKCLSHFAIGLIGRFWVYFSQKWLGSSSSEAMLAAAFKRRGSRDRGGVRNRG